MTDSPSVDVAADNAAASTDVKDPASSSSAEKVVENKTALDAVQAALKGPEKSTDSENKDSNADSKAKTAEEPLPDEVSDEELKRYAPKTQHRVRSLVAQRDEAKARVEQLQPKAQEFDRITDLMVRNHLSKEDVDGGFEIMALIKSNPRQAVEKLAPIVRNLLKAIGAEIPDELKQEIEAGRLSPERARELSMSNAEAQRLRAQQDRDRQQREHDEKSRSWQATVDGAVQAADKWHAEKAAADPDWGLKQNRVVELVELEVHRSKKLPASEKEARALFEKALKQVEDEIKKLRPAPTNVQPMIGGSASPSARPEPKSALEAAQFALKG